MADPLDDPAPPPLTTDTYPHRGGAGGGAALFQAMPGPARRASGTGFLTMPD